MNLNKTLRYAIFIFCILAVVISFAETVNWHSNKNKYNKVYVYKDSSGMYYEKNNEKIYLKSVYDKNGERLYLNIPEDSIVIMYSLKDIPSEAIYLQTYNNDRMVEQPIVCIYLSLSALIVAYYVLPKKNNKKKTNNAIINYYLIYLYIFLLGIGFLEKQVYDTINYNKLKSDNNVVIANLDHEHKIEGKYAFEYDINGNKYIYSKKQLSDEEQLELYYNYKEPSIVYEKGKSIELLILIPGLLLVFFTTPIVFSKNKMAKKYENALNKKY